MWTPTTRAQHSRAGLRYGSDLTDAEWAILEPFLPAACRRGRKRKWGMRQIVSAIFYALRSGCPWQMLPDNFPPPSTVYRWFARFRADGIWETINHHLLMRDRERVGREASPSAAVLDSQSVKTAEAGALRQLSTSFAGGTFAASARAAMMRARRCSGASAMPWSIPTAAR